MHNSSLVPTVAPSDMLTKEDRNTILKCLLKEHQVQREAEKKINNCKQTMRFMKRKHREIRGTIVNLSPQSYQFKSCVFYSSSISGGGEEWMGGGGGNPDPLALLSLVTALDKLCLWESLLSDKTVY